MSFNDRPVPTGRQKFGCAMIAAVALFFTFVAAILAALGSCPECDPDPVVQFILIPGVPLAFITIGILMIRHLMRDKH